MIFVSKPDLVYPSSDGKRMAENTLQYDWIVTIKGGLDGLFLNNANVFVASDLLWYPVEGEPGIATAPDAMVVFGRPKGHRMSYKQWDEGGIPPQVVFEILSGSNDAWEMADKQDFYDTHGVEEYYIYDPHHERLAGFQRHGAVLRRILKMNGWTSPRLGIRFEMTKSLIIHGPDGRPFASWDELYKQRDEAEFRAKIAEAEVEKLRERLRSHGLNANGGQE